MNIRGQMRAVYDRLSRLLGAVGCAYGACDHPADGGITGNLDPDEWEKTDSSGE